MSKRIISISYLMFCRSCLLVLVVAFSLSGCESGGTCIPKKNYSYINPNLEIAKIGRIAVVELKNDSKYPQASSDITDALFQALQKKQLFGLSIVRQNDPAWRSLQLEADATYTLEQTTSIRESLKCDGILIGTITEYRPYPHTAVGLRLKILDLRDGQLLWALEQIWDITDSQTEYSIRRYYKSEKSREYSLQKEHLVSVSPMEFIRFVSSEVADTL